MGDSEQESAGMETPYVPAGMDMPEFTARAIILGLILSAVMAATNAYLGLKVGMTISASIPASVISLLLLRAFFKDVNILEVNVSQTMATAGEGLAAGVIFTVPALLVMGIWDDIEWLDTFIIALLGGVLGSVFTVPLRRVFVVEEALPYPEGVACKEVLVAGDRGGSGLIAIIYALGIGALYGWVVKGFKLTHDKVEGAFEVIGARIYSGSDLSLALLAVGYIVGLQIASYIFLGGVIGFGILVPLFGYLYGWPVAADGTSASLAQGFTIIWSEQIRFVGVGGMVVGGVYTIWKMKSTIASGFLKALQFGDDEEEMSRIPRTERDIDMRIVLLISGVIAVLTFFYFWWAINSFVLALVGAMFLLVAAFFFSAVGGYIAGVVGSSNSPVSGTTIATILFTSLLIWLVGDLFLGLGKNELMFATLIVAGVVCVNAAIAGDVMQNIKTGQLLGSTPKRLQEAMIYGVIVGAIVIAPILWLLNEAFRISQTYCLTNPPESDPTCSNMLLAPQAELIGALIQGIFSGDVNMPMVTLGVLIAFLLIWKKLPVMPVAIGIYLPLFLSVPIVTGGIIHHLIKRSTHYRIDDTLDGKPTQKAVKEAEEVGSRGVLLGAGFIAGESLMGVVIALFIVMDASPAEWFGWMGTLTPSLSLLFYLWFVGIFVYLATRSMPNAKQGNLLTDWLMVLKDSGKRIVVAIKPPSQDEERN